jgi:flagellar biosynthesis protein FlhA
MTTTTTAGTASGFSLRSLLDSQDAALALALVGIIALMILPLPPFMIDLLIATNLALSIGIIMITMYIRQPMEFSAFPTVLLLVTLLRLGINISTSRRILLDGSAGKVIETFGSMVVGGNYVIGVVVFLMLMIIQWVVINNGAGRVAEVAARFTLDALPGKQMSIDADLNAGLIDEGQARLRRREIQEEADFYGSMDGASKFVKGDAIAAVVIMLVNILGGFLIGMLQHQMSALDALQNYTLVTVGAGLAVQIPALLVSAAAGFLVTRSTSDGSLGSSLSGQLSNRNGLIAVAVIITAMALVPGLPKLPFLAIGGMIGGTAYYLWREEQQEALLEEEPQPTYTEPETPQDMLEMIVVDPMEVEVGYGLIPLVDNQNDNLLDRITQLRRQVMSELGLVLPVVRVHDNLNIPPQGS